MAVFFCTDYNILLFLDTCCPTAEFTSILYGLVMYCVLWNVLASMKQGRRK